MKKVYKLLFFIFSYLIIIGSAGANTFYVNGTKGSNSNTPVQANNIATPWQTVQYAVDNAAVADGDIIVVAEGTYSGFNLTKRLNIVGAWKGNTPDVNTVFSSTINLNAPGGNKDLRMILKNLRVTSASGDAIYINKGFVTLENISVSATGTLLNGIRINDTGISDILIESCNLNNNTLAGIFFPAENGVDGFAMRNTTVNDNGYFGILAIQSQSTPNEIKNVEILQCSFINNNPSNYNQGHTIHFEKLKNAVFKNVSVVMPSGNNKTGINLNLLRRNDFSNISILNSRIIRATPGTGIWFQARNEIQPIAKLDTVLVKGVTFSGCDTNIVFSKNIVNVTVDKCDLSNYNNYSLVNLTNIGVVDASNNKWQNGAVPDTTILTGGSITAGSPVMTNIFNTNGILTGMGITGFGISPGTTVISKTATTVTMSQNAFATGTDISFTMAFNFATSTDILKTTTNNVLNSNPLLNTIVNQSNVSYPDLASAISGTSPGGTIWNLPNTLITGTTTIDKSLTLIGPGAGFLHSGSLTTFQNLYVPATFMMGSDFAIAENFSPGNTNITDYNTLMINGQVVAGGFTKGGKKSDVYFGGTGGSTSFRLISGGIRTMHLNRTGGIVLGAELMVWRSVILQNGKLNLGPQNLLIDRRSTLYSTNPSVNYVVSNGTGKLKKFFDNYSPTAFTYIMGAGNYSPVRVCFPGLNINFRGNYDVRVINSKHPEDQCTSNYLNRYWAIDGVSLNEVSADLLFRYNASDVTGSEDSLAGAKYNGFSWTTYAPVDTLNHTFALNGQTEYGDFTAGNPDCIGNFQTVINVKIFLQGAYEGPDSMRTSLLTNGFIPLTQPYNTFPFFYDGTESVTSVPADVVDWVYIELRETANGPALTDGSRAAFIKSDGSIVDLDGTSPVKTGISGGDYYIVIGHRNHLPVMSQNKQTLSITSTLYDFSTGLSKYFGNAAADLGNSQYGMYAGDANKSFIITAADYTIVTNGLFQSGYFQADINLTGIVTASDYTLITSNIFISSSVPNYP